MAFGKTAGCLILGGILGASAAQFTARHKHLNGGCAGILRVDPDGVSFQGAKGHSWRWAYRDIQQLRLEPGAIRVLSYQDDKLRLGKDRDYEFTGNIPATELYPMLRDHMDQRLVAAVTIEQPLDPADLSIPAKHTRTVTGSEGALTFAPGAIVYTTSAKGDSRTWRYTDITGIASAGPLDLTITTIEKGFHFQLKQPLAESRYNQIWLEIERKNGRLQ